MSISQFPNKTISSIIKNYQPEKVVLFGSSTKRGYVKGSDLDLLIIKKTKKNPMERVREVIDLLPHQIDTDIIVLTPEELEQRKQEHHYFIEEILSKGQFLYEK